MTGTYTDRAASNHRPLPMRSRPAQTSPARPPASSLTPPMHRRARARRAEVDGSRRHDGARVDAIGNHRGLWPGEHAGRAAPSSSVRISTPCPTPAPSTASSEWSSASPSSRSFAVANAFLRRLRSSPSPRKKACSFSKPFLGSLALTGRPRCGQTLARTDSRTASRVAEAIQVL